MKISYTHRKSSSKSMSCLRCGDLIIELYSTSGLTYTVDVCMRMPGIVSGVRTRTLTLTSFCLDYSVYSSSDRRQLRPCRRLDILKLLYRTVQLGFKLDKIAFVVSCFWQSSPQLAIDADGAISLSITSTNLANIPSRKSIIDFI